MSDYDCNCQNSDAYDTVVESPVLNVPSYAEYTKNPIAMILKAFEMKFITVTNIMISTNPISENPIAKQY